MNIDSSKFPRRANLTQWGKHLKRMRAGKANYARGNGIWNTAGHGKREWKEQEASSALQRGGEGANCRAV